jgi:hypothetical protein
VLEVVVATEQPIQVLPELMQAVVQTAQDRAVVAERPTVEQLVLAARVALES